MARSVQYGVDESKKKEGKRGFCFVILLDLFLFLLRAVPRIGIRSVASYMLRCTRQVTALRRPPHPTPTSGTGRKRVYGVQVRTVVHTWYNMQRSPPRLTPILTHQMPINTPLIPPSHAGNKQMIPFPHYLVSNRYGAVTSLLFSWTWDGR